MNNNGFKGFDIIATFINAIALIVTIFTVYIPWYDRGFTNYIDIGCIISIVLLLIGTMLEVLGGVNNKNILKVNSFLAINIWFYGLVPGVVCIYVGTPYMWPYILHIFVVMIAYIVFLFRFFKNK